MMFVYCYYIYFILFLLLYVSRRYFYNNIVLYEDFDCYSEFVMWLMLLINKYLLYIFGNL